jgi:hypothetical protein
VTSGLWTLHDPPVLGKMPPPSPPTHTSSLHHSLTRSLTFSHSLTDFHTHTPQSCPGNCNGHGRCLTDAAKLYHHGSYTPNAVPRVSPTSPGATTHHHLPPGLQHDGLFGTASFWHGDFAASCVCDPGYAGLDCALRTCPTGDDPLTLCDEDTGSDVQEIQCHALPTGDSNSSSSNSTLVWISLWFQASNGLEVETHPIAVDAVGRSAEENARAMQVRGGAFRVCVRVGVRVGVCVGVSVRVCGFVCGWVGR